jgi:hypothetical protein
MKVRGAQAQPRWRPVVVDSNSWATKLYVVPLESSAEVCDNDFSQKSAD